MTVYATRRGMTARYLRAFEWLMDNEGSTYVNDPYDHGGPTKYGITLASWGSWIGHPAQASDVAAITIDDAKSFYHETYWLPLNGDIIASEIIHLAIFDMSVLMGLRRVVRISQHICGATVDGILGPKTVACLSTIPDAEFMAAFCKTLEEHITVLVQRDPSQEKFFPSWLTRIQKLESLTDSGVRLGSR